MRLEHFFKSGLSDFDTVSQSGFDLGTSGLWASRGSCCAIRAAATPKGDSDEEKGNQKRRVR